MTFTYQLRTAFVVMFLLSIGTLTLQSAYAADSHTSGVFQGVKVSRGTVTHTNAGGKSVLNLSDDFQMPQAPDPHWQVIDSRGNVYLLDKLSLKGGRFQKSITLPSYV